MDLRAALCPFSNLQIPPIRTNLGPKGVCPGFGSGIDPLLMPNATTLSTDNLCPYQLTNRGRNRGFPSVYGLHKSVTPLIAQFSPVFRPKGNNRHNICLVIQRFIPRSLRVTSQPAGLANSLVRRFTMKIKAGDRIQRQLR